MYKRAKNFSAKPKKANDGWKFVYQKGIEFGNLKLFSRPCHGALEKTL